MKGQVVADFIAKFTNMEGQGAGECSRWSIPMVRSSNKQTGEAGVVIHSLEGDKVECMVWLDFLTTNNEAEYKALIARMNLAKVARVVDVVVYCDLQVVTS